MSRARSGALLVVVAGLSALMAALALAFLVRMRSDGEETALVAQEIQARAMLSAALMYVQETSRLGWGLETYGWRDVRDGMAGPRGFDGAWPAALAGAVGDDGRAPGGRGAFPAIDGRAARCPMEPMRRPPWAIKPIVAPNPVPLSDPTDVAALSRPWSELVAFTAHDPQPVAEAWADFAAGDRRPLGRPGIPAWFRVRRSGVATFVLTCGAGGTLGYRDWPEVQADGAEAAFGSAVAFRALRAAETVLWYEAEWTDHVTGENFMHGHFARFNQRVRGACDVSWAESPNMRQFAGTFAWIARCVDEPPDW